MTLPAARANVLPMPQDEPPPEPTTKSTGRAAEARARDAARKSRLAAALRENLKRRKAPARDGDGGDAGQTPGVVRRGPLG